MKKQPPNEDEYTIVLVKSFRHWKRAGLSVVQMQSIPAANPQ